MRPDAARLPVRGEKERAAVKHAVGPAGWGARGELVHTVEDPEEGGIAAPGGR